MKFIFLLSIIGLTVFVVQQSHLIETKKVMDTRLGVEIDQTNVRWENLRTYFEKLKEDFEDSTHRKKRLRESF